MTEEELVRKGFTIIGRNLYKKDGVEYFIANGLLVRKDGTIERNM